MRHTPKIEAMTNTTPKSCVDVNCDCNTMWSMAQQFSTMRLCSHTGEFKGELISGYATRARRISATYARFYLEKEDGGDPEKKGRYYWMALGAFASKTVACTFDAWQVKGLLLLTSTVWKGLGKGNFWLFCDISGWHWYHNMYPKSFDSCLSSRDSSKYVAPVQAQMKNLPWKEKALPIIENFAVSKEIKAGFAKVKEFEQEVSHKNRPKIQFDHLLEIANHEQGVILQPLIYADPDFAFWVRSQRGTIAGWISPELELVFNHTCAVKNPELKSVASKEIELENFKSRMIWILEAGKIFHGLMQKQTAYMENELNIMANWVDMPDPRISMIKAQ